MFWCCGNRVTTAREIPSPWNQQTSPLNDRSGSRNITKKKQAEKSGPEHRSKGSVVIKESKVQKSRALQSVHTSAEFRNVAAVGTIQTPQSIVFSRLFKI